MNNELTINDFWEIPDFGITVDPVASYIPFMPEVINSDTSIAGMDGEINLSTVYAARNFDLVCYSKEGLNLREKNFFKRKVAKFLHQHKNEPFRLVIKPYNVSYDVKYNGAIDPETYPQSVRVSIPLKSYKSFGYENMKSELIGDGTIESITVEPVGFICTIKGPITSPATLSLNGVDMVYNDSILEGEKLIINSKISTVTKIDSQGIESNVIKHYNKEFPKIVEGDNTLEIISGIENSENVSLEWYDLAF